MPWLFGFVHIPAQAGVALCEAALKPDRMDGGGVAGTVLRRLRRYPLWTVGAALA